MDLILHYPFIGSEAPRIEYLWSPYADTSMPFYGYGRPMDTDMHELKASPQLRKCQLSSDVCASVPVRRELRDRPTAACLDTPATPLDARDVKSAATSHEVLGEFSAEQLT